MAEPTIKELQGERNRLWAEARLKGLPAGTPQRDRIAELDAIIRERKLAKQPTDAPASERAPAGCRP
jgi:hypothetical protein